LLEKKGTIVLLKDWLSIKFRTPDTKAIDTMIETFLKVRNMRNKPAHKVGDDKFDREYVKEQRRLMIEVYSAIRTLRLIFANHPKTKTFVVPEWLFKADIWTF
jgi:hypothetical protein